MTTATGPLGTAPASPPGLAGAAAREQSRARYPDQEGFVERGGQRLFYEVYGEGEETVFLMPTWSLAHSRHWKMQIPYLARKADARLPLVGRLNAVHWMREYPEFCEWWISRCLPEPHSTKAIEDGVGWALDTDPETLIATALGDWLRDRRTLRGLAQNLDCPVLVIHGDHDRITPLRDGRALARLGSGELELVKGAGHFPHTRKPVQVNLALRRFSEQSLGRPRAPRDPTAYRTDGRPRALYISSPIGLGHAQRDVETDGAAKAARHIADLL